MRWRPASEAWLLWVGWLSVVLGGGGKGGVSVDVTSKCRWPFSSPAFFSFVRLGVGWRWADSIFVHTRTRHVFWTAGGPATFALSLRPLVAVVWGACPNQSASAPHFSARFQRANNSCEKARASGRPSPPQKTPCRRGLFFLGLSPWPPGHPACRLDALLVCRVLRGCGDGRGPGPARGSPSPNTRRILWAFVPHSFFLHPPHANPPTPQ